MRRWAPVACAWCAAAAPLGGSCRVRLPLPGAAAPGSAAGGEGARSGGALADGGVREWRDLLELGVYGAENLSGYMTLPAAETAEIDANRSESMKCSPSTFGEMNARRLFADPLFRMGGNDVLVDLGGGVGKSVVGGVMIFNASQGFSVELSESRLERACQALERLEGVAGSRACGRACSERAGRPGLVEMVHGDLMDFDLSAATVVLAFSTCYPLDFQARLQRKLLWELRPGARVYAPQHKGWDEGLVLGGRTLTPIPYDFGHAFRVVAADTAQQEL